MEDAWEIVSAVSEFSFVAGDSFSVVDDELDDTISVSTANGFPAHARIADLDMISVDSGATTAALPVLTFKEALMFGAGGLTSAKAVALQRAPTRLSLVPRKPRKAKALEAAPSFEDYDADYEYYSRKERGQRLYRLRAPRAAFSAKTEMCTPIAEVDQEASDFDDSDDMEY